MRGHLCSGFPLGGTGRDGGRDMGTKRVSLTTMAGLLAPASRASASNRSMKISASIVALPSRS